MRNYIILLREEIRAINLTIKTLKLLKGQEQAIEHWRGYQSGLKLAIAAAKKGFVLSKSPQNNWQDDSIQFCRLIAEAESNGRFEGQALTEIAESMDLTEEEVCLLIDRAQDKWSAIKKELKKA